MKERTRTALGPLAVLIALMAVAACDDSTAPTGEDALTEAEAVALVDGLAVVARLVSDDAASPVPAEPVVQCPLGGTVGFSVTATTDSTAAGQVLSSETVVTPRNCQFTARGTTFTANGAPDVRQSGDLTITGFFERVEFDYDIAGAVDWETGSPARQGTCSLDLDLTGEVELPGVESTDTVAVVRGTLSGTACDAAVNLPLDSIGGR